MRTRETIARLHRIGIGVILLGGILLGIAGGLGAADDRRPPAVRGQELFAHEWRPQDARSRGGDGLGPVYNDTSCVACHNLGAPGGAGADNKNVDILTAVASDNRLANAIGKALLFRPKIDVLLTVAAGPDLGELAKVHAGFASARSVVLHRFGTDPSYERWRLGLLGIPAGDGEPGPEPSRDEQRSVIERMRRLESAVDPDSPVSRVGGFVLFRSRRNPTSLFGAGRIDAIPDRVLEEGSKHINSSFPEIIGRVSRLKDGRIGRFGWKAQTASLEDFVLTACAVELGLDVPGHHQAGLPMAGKAGAPAPGLDLGAEDCADLVAYVKGLPAPTMRMPSDQQGAEAIRAGRAEFERIGCAACHRPKLGEVDGLYSDLLLHDMGGTLGDTGSYGIFAPGLLPTHRTIRRSTSLPARLPMEESGRNRPAEQRVRSGGPRRYGACATPPPTCTTAAPGPSSARSPCMTARPRHGPALLRARRAKSAPRSRASSSRWALRSRERDSPAARGARPSDRHGGRQPRRGDHREHDQRHAREVALDAGVQQPPEEHRHGLDPGWIDLVGGGQLAEAQRQRDHPGGQQCPDR